MIFPLRARAMGALILAGAWAPVLAGSECRLPDDPHAARWNCSMAASGQPSRYAAVKGWGAPTCKEGAFDPGRGTCVRCPSGTAPVRVGESGMWACARAVYGARSGSGTRSTRETATISGTLANHRAPVEHDYANPMTTGPAVGSAPDGGAGIYDSTRHACGFCPAGMVLSGNAADSDVACRSLPPCLSTPTSGFYGWHCALTSGRDSDSAPELVLDRVDCACREARREAAEAGGLCRYFTTLTTRLYELKRSGTVLPGPEYDALEFYFEKVQNIQSGRWPPARGRLGRG